MGRMGQIIFSGSHGTGFVPWAFLLFNADPTAIKPCRGYPSATLPRSTSAPERGQNVLEWTHEHHPFRLAVSPHPRDTSRRRAAHSGTLALHLSDAHSNPVGAESQRRLPAPNQAVGNVLCRR